jgi:hypothetical protein
VRVDLVEEGNVRITVTIVVARALLALVPRLERFVSARAGARSTQGSTATASMVHQSQRVETLVRVSGSVARWDPLTELLLHNAARREHLRNLIQPVLYRGVMPFLGLYLCALMLITYIPWLSLGPLALLR